MFFGVMLILAACASWGLIFVIPEFLQQFSPFEVALGRYLSFGFFAALFFIFKIKRLQKILSRRLVGHAFLFAFVANLFHYSSVVLGLRLANPAITTLILGLSPLTITFFGKPSQKSSYIFPSIFIACGLFFVHLHALQTELCFEPTLRYLWGLIFALLGLATWTYYMIANDRILQEHPQLSSLDWVSCVGVATLILGLFFALLYGSFFSLSPLIFSNEKINHFILGSLALGLISSFAGSYFWNHASKFVAIHIAGTLTIFETIFGLLFIFVAQQKIPTFIEVLGIIFMLSGVFLGLYKTKKIKLITST